MSNALFWLPRLLFLAHDASRQTHKIEINEYFIKSSECLKQGRTVGTSYNSRTHKAEAEESGVEGQPGLEDPILNW